jgi:hypothetical protein
VTSTGLVLRRRGKIRSSRRLTAVGSAVPDADDCAVAVRDTVRSAPETILTGLVAQLNPIKHRRTVNSGRPRWQTATSACGTSSLG